MSRITVDLMRRPLPSAAARRRWGERLSVVADRLVSEFGVPTLGNFRDPVKEIFYILLSARTTDAQYRKTHRALYERFPALGALAEARRADLLNCIAGGGLANKRAGQIKRTASTLLGRLGPHPSAALRAMSSQEAFDFLTNLPGMGPKSALCVMMCSLHADVFPVDVNVQRVSVRLGIIRKGLKHYQAQQRLPGLVPAGRSKELHVGMVELGRKVCLPKRPRCGECPIRDLCPTGIRKTSRST